MDLISLAWYIPYFLKSQFLDSVSYPTASFAGQTVIITGSNVGLGLEAARHVVRLQASKVILAVRTLTKGQTAAEDITASCKVPENRIEVWHLNMSSVASVRDFAKRAATLERLDAVILNAGMLTGRFEVVEGVEEQLAVNTVNTMLLTLLLLPTMRASARKTGLTGRLAHVGSDLMYVAPMAELEADGSMVDNLSNAERSVISQRYQLSKLLDFYAVRELTDRYWVADLGVIVDVVTPGACESSIFRDQADPKTKAIADFVKGLVQRTTEVGARTLVHSVETQLKPETHGKFLMNGIVGYDGRNVTGAKGKRLARKWNEELYARLEAMVPGCTRL